MAKILVVDDREDNLLSIGSILEKDNYTIIKASSGRNALKILLNEYDFALILMDVEMPDLNGFDTASLIYERQKLRHIPIIFITAHSYGDESIFKGYQTGAVDYIYKPINPDLLKAKVKVFVDLYRKNHQLMIQEQKLTAINKSLETEINERKMSEEKIHALNLQLLQNIDKLEAANKELDRFAFMASHDLQEPLRKIRTFADRLHSKYKSVFDEDGLKYLSRMQFSAERMQNLIQDILTFSKIGSHDQKFIESDLNTLLKDVLEEIKSEIEKVEIKIDASELPVLFVNPGLIRTLFHNLINNAIKYRKADVRHLVRIYSDKDEQGTEKKYHRIYFEDNGIGFDQKYSDQVFKMFTRLHQQNIEGNGIGLALCKKIVEEHQGYISVRSRENEGTVFIISIPISGGNNSLKLNTGKFFQSN